MLPDAIYAIPGVESNIYYKNIFLTVNYADYIFEAKCKAGRNDQDRWRFLPQEEDAGKEFPLTIQVKNQHGIVAEATTTVYVVPADAGKGKNITLLMVGDSLTDAAVFPARVKELFDQDNNVDLTMIGSRTKEEFPGVIHEGHSGWAWSTFLLKVPKKEEKDPSKFLFPQGDGFAFDLRAYLDRYCHGKMPDFITFQLGVNDVFCATDANRKQCVAKILKNADKLLAEFRKQAPEAIIGVGFTTPSSCSQDAFGFCYKCDYTMWGYAKNQFLLIQKMQSHFAKKMKKDKKLFMIPTQVNLDRDHNFPSTEETINLGNPEKVIRISNGVHPATAGYRQMGDTLYTWLKYQLFKMK